MPARKLKPVEANDGSYAGLVLAAFDAMEAREITYRGYTISHDPPPIPDRRFDWSYVHEDYDGAPNNPGEGPADHRCGHAASVGACRAEIDEIEDDA